MESVNNYIKTAIEKEAFQRGGADELIGQDGSRSPWMFDFKTLTLKGEFLQAYVKLFFAHYQNFGPFQVGGLELGAIPLIVAISLESASRGMLINSFFIRKSRKKDGKMSLVEGKITAEPIILVDDLVHSGQSLSGVIATLELLREQGLSKAAVTEIFSILRFRDESAYTDFAARGIKFTSLFELNDFRDSLGLTNLPALASKVRYNAYRTLWYWRGEAAELTPVLPKAELLLTEGKIYFGADSGDLVCLNGQTGEVVWRYHVLLGKRGRTVFSSPVSCGNLVVFGSRDGNVYALDRATGERAWVLFEADWLQGDLAAGEDSGYLFIPLSFGLFKRQGKVVSVNARTGEKHWEYNLTAPLGGGIAYSRTYRMVFFGSEDGRFQALEAKTGKLVWATEVAVKPRGVPVVCEATNTILFGGVPTQGATDDDRGYFYSLDVKTGKPVFMFKDFCFGTYSTACFCEQRVFFTALDKYLYCLDLATGTLLWRTNLGARSFASPITWLDEKGKRIVCVGANNGFLQMYDGGTGKLIATIKLTERILNRVIYEAKSGLLYIPTQANEVYALKPKD